VSDRSLPAIAAAKKKNDRIDAGKIADCLRCDFLPEWPHDDCRDTRSKAHVAVPASAGAADGADEKPGLWTADEALPALLSADNRPTRKLTDEKPITRPQSLDVLTSGLSTIQILLLATSPEVRFDEATGLRQFDPDQYQ
jgi:hypothetical protein